MLFRVVVATVTQLSYLQRSLNPDFTFDSFPYVICTQTVLALSLVTACVPYLQPFLESLNTGMLWTDDMQRQGNASTGQDSYSSTRNLRAHTNLESQPGLSITDTELKTVRDRYETSTTLV